MNHPGLKALKVGITNVESTMDRIAQHRRHGWELSEAWFFQLGHQAEVTEQMVLSWWREELNAPAALKKSQTPQGGHTETVSLDLVGVEETIEFVERAIDELPVS